MKLESESLLPDLVLRTKQVLNDVKGFKRLTIEELNSRKSENSWSILECVEHLNLYAEYYNPEIIQSINNTNETAVKSFKSGLLGNYFAVSMLSKSKLNKMKTFKNKNPIGSMLDIDTISKFIVYQEELLEILDKAKKVNLNKTKTSISISRFLKLKLGDTLRVVIYHNQRHMVQAKSILTN